MVLVLLGAACSDSRLTDQAAPGAPTDEPNRTPAEWGVDRPGMASAVDAWLADPTTAAALAVEVDALEPGGRVDIDLGVARGADRAGPVQDVLPMSRRNLLAFEGPARAFDAAFKGAGINVTDVDFAEVHDCFTIAELLCYEAMGLAETGRGSDVIAAGTVFPDGDLPINLSG